jgi:hypothetical protein
MRNKMKRINQSWQGRQYGVGDMVFVARVKLEVEVVTVAVTVIFIGVQEVIVPEVLDEGQSVHVPA